MNEIQELAKGQGVQEAARALIAKALIAKALEDKDAVK